MEVDTGASLTVISKTPLAEIWGPTTIWPILPNVDANSGKPAHPKHMKTEYNIHPHQTVLQTADAILVCSWNGRHL